MVETPSTLAAGTLKRIHVDQRRIRANAKDDTALPPITVQAAGGPYKATKVEILGPSAVVYDGRQLSCGARLWIETRAEVRTS